MKWTRQFVLMTLTAAVLTWAGPAWADTDNTAVDLENAGEDGRISYAIGYDLTRRLKDSFSIDPDLFLKGMTDNLSENPGMTPEEIQQTLMAFQTKAQNQQMAARQKQSEQNKVDGAAFLDENKTKDGVKTLASGLQYKVITPGDGESPGLEDTVKCHYKGTLINGTVFDSSYQRNEPAVFPVKGVIKGWTEALQLMKVGAKWMLYIPSDLAYGDQGAGNRIEPGSTLIFEVELLEIQDT